MEVLGKGGLPLDDPSLEAFLDLDVLEVERTNLLGVVNVIDVLLEVGELKKLCLELLKLRVLGVELAQAIIDAFLPEPVEAAEVIKEAQDGGSSALDRTSRAQ